MLAVLAVAIVVGVLVGLATGGRIGQLAGTRLRALGLLVVGAGAQALVLDGVVSLHGWAAMVVLLGAYAALAGFAAANLGRGGMGVILAGIALNAVPIAVNSGMPVEAGAIVRARIATPDELPLLTFGAKRHLAGTGDHLRFLDDRFPEWVTHHVLSFGDLVIGVGVGAVTSGLLHPATGRRRRRSRSVAPGPEPESGGPDPMRAVAVPGP
jgi:hypothetical protein